MSITRLNHLPAEIKNILHPDFIFLISTDKIQHFPVRGWQQAAFQESIETYFPNEKTQFIWEDKLVISNKRDLLMILPCFTEAFPTK